MRQIYDAEQIEYWLNKRKIRNCFDTSELDFYIRCYEKGEYLVVPNEYMEDLLFVVNGTIQIYGIGEEGSILPVNHIDCPALIGDIEFSTRKIPIFFVEAKTAVTCIALDGKKHRKKLERDITFLHVLIESIVGKLQLSAFVDASASTIEEKVLLYMKNISSSHELKGMDTAAHQLRCSRRQLQRVMRKLCEDGQVIKLGKGWYKLKN